MESQRVQPSSTSEVQILEDRVKKLEIELLEARRLLLQAQHHEGVSRPEWGGFVREPGPAGEQTPYVELSEVPFRHPGAPFFIKYKDDLYLDTLSDLAWQILEALPVTVFVKFADYDKQEKKGRRFTFMNRLARKRLGWSFDEVRNRYDSEAFPDKSWNNPAYQRMLHQESITLCVEDMETGLPNMPLTEQSYESDNRTRDTGQLNAKSRYTFLEWQYEATSGRRSRTLEVPVYLSGKDSPAHPIGFCAIAEELDFTLSANLAHFYLSMFSHEMGTVTYQASDAFKQIAKYISSNTGENQDALFKKARYFAELLPMRNQMYEEMMKAFDTSHNANRIRLQMIVQDLRSFYGEPTCPWQISIIVQGEQDSLLRTRVRRPDAVKALVHVLIGNAVDHCDKQHGDRAKAEVLFGKANGQLRVSVRNISGSRPARSVVLDLFPRWATKVDGPGAGFSGKMIGEILLQNYPELNARDLNDAEHPLLTCTYLDETKEVEYSIGLFTFEEAVGHDNE